MNEIANISRSALELSGSYTSMKLETREDKVALFNAMTNPEHRLRDHINEVIRVRDVYAEVIELVDGQTGEARSAVRTVLIDVNGVSYTTSSSGVANSLNRIFAVFGEPTWEGGLPVKVKQINNKERQILTLSIV